MEYKYETDDERFKRQMQKIHKAIQEGNAGESETFSDVFSRTLRDIANGTAPAAMPETDPFMRILQDIQQGNVPDVTVKRASSGALFDRILADIQEQAPAEMTNEQALREIARLERENARLREKLSSTPATRAQRGAKAMDLRETVNLGVIVTTAKPAPAARPFPKPANVPLSESAQAQLIARMNAANRDRVMKHARRITGPRVYVKPLTKG